MKKVFCFILTLIFIITLVACSRNTNTDPIEESVNNSESSSSDTSSDESDVTEPFETVSDNGSVEYEETYTMKDILEIKTNWNAEYAFPCDTDNVVIEKEDDTNLKMSLLTNEISYEKAVKFYDKYTANKEGKSKTTTLESCFYSFEEDYVTRTIMIVKNRENIAITISYSMDNVNKR